MHIRRSTVTSMLLVGSLAFGLTGFVSAAPAILPTGGTAETDAAPAPQHPSRWRAATSQATWTVSDAGVQRHGGNGSALAALETIDDLRSPDAPGAALRAHLAALTGEAPAGPGEALDETDEYAALAPAPTAWTRADPVPDLDSDGLDDVMLSSLDSETGQVTLTALRGSDGTELWSHSDGEIADLWTEAVPDVTGDGTGDLLVWDLSFDDWGCEDEYCDTWFEEFTWTVRVRDGRTGTVAWTTAYPGSFRDSWIDEGGSSTWGYEYEYGWRIEAENYWIVPFVSDDHDGDGRRDVIVNQLGFVGVEDRDFRTYEDQLPIYNEGTSRDVDMRSTVSLVDGSDGVEFWQRAAEGHDGDAVALPFGDAAGSATDDLLWLQWGYPTGTESCRYVDTPLIDPELGCEDTLPQEWTLAAELLDGDTREPGWSRSAIDGPSDLTAFTPADADLDGDGTDDLFEVVDHYDDDTGELVSDIVARSGSDGEALWSATGAAAWPMAVGSLDGGSGADIVIAGAEFTESPDETWLTTVNLQRLDGATGADLLATSHVFVDTWDTFTYVGVYLDDDVDGDAIGDLGLWSYTYDYEADEETSSEMLESSATGAELFRLDDGDRFIYHVADVDGDGPAEILVGTVITEIVRIWGEEWEIPVALDVHAQQSTGETVWTLPRLDYWEDWLAIGGDLDGIPGADLVETRNVTDPRGTTVRNGATAAIAWTR